MPGAHGRLALAWDEIARTNAYDQQKRLAGDDPEAAAILRAHLAPPPAPAASVPTDAAIPPDPMRLDEPDAPGYHPMRLYAQVAKLTGWTVREMDETHFETFFGLVREWTLLAEEEERSTEAKLEEQRRAQGTGGIGGSAIPGLPGGDLEAQALLQSARRILPYRPNG